MDPAIPIDKTKATPTAQTPTADHSQRKAWLVGAGIGSLSAAAFMIRDGGMTGGEWTEHGGHLRRCGPC